MGPTNVALVKLFLADQLLRAAQSRLDAVTREVRIQERRLNDFTEKQKLQQHQLREAQSKSGQYELEMKVRDEHIEKLRTQQQSAIKHKEYQAYLIEINTLKADHSKFEENALKVMESIEKMTADLAALTTTIEEERGKLDEMKSKIADKIAALQADIDSFQPARESAAAVVPPRALQAFDRLADRFEGEAMAAISKPDRRSDEYMCSGCNLSLVVDTYYRLHSKDEIIECRSCGRMLYIPDDMPVESAAGAKKKAPAAPRTKKPRAPKVSKAAAAEAAEDPAPDMSDVPVPSTSAQPLNQLLTAAQGESVRNAMAAGNDPVECDVIIDGQPMGSFKGQNVGNLERIIKFRLGEANKSVAELIVRERSVEPAQQS